MFEWSVAKHSVAVTWDFIFIVSPEFVFAFSLGLVILTW